MQKNSTGADAMREELQKKEHTIEELLKKIKDLELELKSQEYSREKSENRQKESEPRPVSDCFFMKYIKCVKFEINFLKNTIKLSVSTIVSIGNENFKSIFDTSKNGRIMDKNEKLTILPYSLGLSIFKG